MSITVDGIEFESEEQARAYRKFVRTVSNKVEADEETLKSIEDEYADLLADGVLDNDYQDVETADYNEVAELNLETIGDSDFYSEDLNELQF